MFSLNKKVIDRAMREKNIKTYTELADRTLLNKVQLSNMLNSEYSPIKSNVLSLMKELDLSFEEIIKKRNESVKKDLQLASLDIFEQLDLKFEDLDDVDYISENKKYKLEEYEDFSLFSPESCFNVIETFAGAGGLSLGLEKANLKTRIAIELDKYAAETLKVNIKDALIIQDDINNVLKVGFDSYGIKKNDIDILSGGYPCQSFSYAGKRNGLADVRGTLFKSYAETLSKLKPKVFIAENVKGLITHDKGKTLYTMINIFEKEGYKIYWNLFNSWDYDVAQKRQRIFIIGIRKDLLEKEKYSFKFPLPTGNNPVLKDVIKDVPDSPGVKYSEKKEKVMKLVPPGGCWVDLPESIAKEYMGASYYSGGGKRGMARRLSWEEPSLTLTTSPNQKQTERCHPEETRPLKVNEYSRIQGFPDSWKFVGSIGNKYKQIGNAVPVNLAKYIGFAVNNYLEQFK
ncbi:DNA (cytosine-5-)-methyltransferase [Staphylococcus aureus]|uniref:DNA (cytosine-5-)-methyltransferase n=5 Tax=Staphylococcus aureus TaxID=1280 RepID=UPI00044F3C8E|nr:DNA (cytosine-5-)-methyltransferase [Staphylococcus aureus]KAB90693.1 hypothetical protein W489_02642 [Staphylococcus aureus VET0190R]MCQ9894667.1 DNA (cytosine-5-)-methyltransferase [Staphylococcus aureus]MCT6687238.1 DNA (cytosine-5-)-methyltransferase [Staphylococcus aureus]